MNPAPPLPRSGKLMAGGPNALELVWAMLALTAALATIAASAIAWAALEVEGWLTGTGWDTPVLDMPAALLDLAVHRDATHTSPGPSTCGGARPLSPVCSPLRV